MRNLKLFAVACAIMVSSNIFAESNSSPKSKPLSYEMEKLLSNRYFTIDNDHKGKVLFSLNEESKIVVHYVQFHDKEVRQYILEKLQDQELKNHSLEIGKVYALPLQMKK